MLYAVVRTYLVNNITPDYMIYAITSDEKKAQELCDTINNWVDDNGPDTRRLLQNAKRSKYAFGRSVGLTYKDKAVVAPINELPADMSMDAYIEEISKA
jgi:hypothetical protein